MEAKREYDELSKEIEEEMAEIQQETLTQYSEAMLPYLEENIPLPDPVQEIELMENWLFQQLLTNSNMGEDPGEPSGIALPPYFVDFAASLHGASHIFKLMVTETEYEISSGFGVHNQDGHSLIEAGHIVGHDDFKHNIILLTIPIFNRFMIFQKNTWKREKEHFDSYRNMVTSIFFDSFTESGNGDELSYSTSNLCDMLYSRLEHDNEMQGTDDPFGIKPSETVAFAMTLIKDLRNENEEVGEDISKTDDFSRINRLFALGTRKFGEVAYTDWPINWPYGLHTPPPNRF